MDRRRSELIRFTRWFGRLRGLRSYGTRPYQILRGLDLKPSTQHQNARTKLTPPQSVFFFSLVFFSHFFHLIWIDLHATLSFNSSKTSGAQRKPREIPPEHTITSGAPVEEHRFEVSPRSSRNQRGGWPRNPSHHLGWPSSCV